MIYVNNTEIVNFINKAQNKIAELSSLLVQRGGNIPDVTNLLLELSDFIECLDNEFNNWLEEDIIRWIHSYNQRANLNSIPFLLLTGFKQSILGGGGSISLPITTADVSDYIPSTNRLIRATPHNSLSTLQGGSLQQRYHLTLAELTFLQNLINPFVAPTINFIVTPTPNIPYQEKGTIVNSTTLEGSYVLNSGELLVSYRYLRLGRVPEQLLQLESTVVSPLLHRESISTNTTFRFEAVFTKGGTLAQEKSVLFTPPMWFGLSTRNAPVFAIQLLVKVIEGPTTVHDFIYNIPADNTSRPLNTQVVPYILVSKSKGTLSRFEVLTFDTLPDWTITSVNVTLQDGSLEACWLCEFKNTVIGSYDFKVLWT